MRSLAEWVFDFGYKREWYVPVRDDFVRWYIYAYDHPSVPKQFSEVNISRLAYQAGRSAVNYEPNNAITYSIDAFEEIRSRLKTIFYYLVVISSISGAIAAGAWQIDLNIVIPGIFGSFSLILLSPPAVYFVIMHQLNSNAELVRKINKKLVIMDLDLWADRNPRHRVAYFYWNRSLNKPKTIVVLVFLMLVRGISPRMYGRVNEYLRENMTEYMDRGVWEVSKEELKRVWNQAVEME